MSFLSSWKYRKSKIIAGTIAGAQTNYQLRLTVYKGVGIDTNTKIYTSNKCKIDFSDLRFTKADGESYLDYYIVESVIGVSAIIDVEIATMPASPNTTTIYIYYGNSSASAASSARNTYKIFDDFSAGSADQWTLINCVEDRIVNHRLDFTGTGGGTSARINYGVDIGNFKWQYSYLVINTGISRGAAVAVTDTITSNYSAVNDGAAAMHHEIAGGTRYKWLYGKVGGIADNTGPEAGLEGVEYFVTFTKIGNDYTFITYSDNDRTIIVANVTNNIATTNPLSQIYAMISALDAGNDLEGWFKNYIIQNYINPEPTYGATGSEEISSTEKTWLGASLTCSCKGVTSSEAARLGFGKRRTRRL